jgi:diadenosine tetraphosphatase ApaH/serine/threonine PP2A family protein phosphatase
MRTLLVTAALALAGCAHLKDSTTVCPEYRDLRCLTAPDCSFDRGRDCEVCHCSDKGFPTPKAL